MVEMQAVLPLVVVAQAVPAVVVPEPPRAALEARAVTATEQVTPRTVPTAPLAVEVLLAVMAVLARPSPLLEMVEQALVVLVAVPVRPVALAPMLWLLLARPGLAATVALAPLTAVLKVD